MSHKIYTKTGDKGTTSLLGGQKVSKSHNRIDAYGTVDELNSYIGLLAAYTINETYQPFLTAVQNQLFIVGSLLATEEEKAPFELPEITPKDVEALENEIDVYTSQLPPLKQFILPGGHREVAFCHIARCVCRRAERAVVRLGEEEQVLPILIQYLNRLSDYLFVFARIMSQNLGAPEIKWSRLQ